MYHANLSKYIEKGYNWLLREIKAELEPDALNKKISEERQKRYDDWRDAKIEMLEVKQRTPQQAAEHVRAVCNQSKSSRFICL